MIKLTDTNSRNSPPLKGKSKLEGGGNQGFIGEASFRNKQVGDGFRKLKMPEATVNSPDGKSFC